MKSAKATQYLLNAGAWITEGPCGETELHEAAANNLLEILQILLSDKRITIQNINQKDRCDRTPAYRAAYTGGKDCLKLLLLSGANLSSITATKESVLDTIFLRVQNPAEFLKDILDCGVMQDKEEKIVLGTW